MSDTPSVDADYPPERSEIERWRESIDPDSQLPFVAVELLRTTLGNHEDRLEAIERALVKLEQRKAFQ